MRDFRVEQGPLSGLVIIKGLYSRVDEDQTYNKEILKSSGFDIDFVQENQSMSYKGVLRGVHLQKCFQQGKLIRVLKGKIFDVAVDMRKNSTTYKQWYAIEISEENKIQFYIPEGFAHGFLALEDAIVSFKVTEYFHPEDEIGFIWSDPEIKINWPITSHIFNDKVTYKIIDGTSIILGKKDRNLPFIKDLDFF